MPQNFKTFDFFDKSTGVAISAKTMDTLTDPKLDNPAQVYASVKSYIDAAANFDTYVLSEKTLEASQISARTLELAIPQATTAAQWQQLRKAVECGASKGVTVNITGIR